MVPLKIGHAFRMIPTLSRTPHHEKEGNDRQDIHEFLPWPVIFIEVVRRNGSCSVIGHAVSCEKPALLCRPLAANRNFHSLAVSIDA